MPFNTLSVSAAITPSVIETWFSHYLHRTPLRAKPTAHISYHEGLSLIREFLDYSSKHTVEELQNFTAQYVPSPTWVRINDAEIAPKFLDRAREVVRRQLGERGLRAVGGAGWWTWRGELGAGGAGELRAEWIEMKKEYLERKRTGAKCERVILYVHGGAYYFGSVDEHRYQMQRHARKLKARVLAPRYRLAPQFPFPCGLYDCLATYFYLLEHFEPEEILFAGDSAGGGKVLSMLVMLRDQGEPLPAGTILLSPWVDLTHSFPSVAGDGSGDYIPGKGFHHKPSMAWPPPASKDGDAGVTNGVHGDVAELPTTDGFDITQQRSQKSTEDGEDETTIFPSPVPHFGDPLSVTINGTTTPLPEQIQLYAPNNLLSHPLVSPVLQPSLGGLPPMLIQTGGAELLKDEQIYLAHKAANPAAYPPNQTIMREFDPDGKVLEKWPPTDVQLQVWDDLCHVAQTLSFTRPAKYMYRGIAQFGAWALSRAKDGPVDVLTNDNDDAESIISSVVEDTNSDSKSLTDSTASSPPTAKDILKKTQTQHVGKAGDPLPLFVDHMIRQRVTRHGVILPLDSISDLACLQLPPSSIGVPKAGPVGKWLAARANWDTKFASETRKVAKRRAKEVALGYDAIPGENPPFTALVRRRRNGVVVGEDKKSKSGKRGWGLAMWSGWGSLHDEQTLQREEKKNNEVERKTSAGTNGAPTRERAGSAAGVYADSTISGVGGGRVRRRSSVAARIQRPWLSTSALAASRSPQSTAPEPTTTTEHDESAVDEQVDARSRDFIPPSSLGFSGLNIQMPNGVGGRPMSASVNSPIPVENELRHRRQESRNARDAPIAIPPSLIVEPLPKAEGSTAGPEAAAGSSAQPNGTETNDVTTTQIDNPLPVVQEIGPPPTPHLELAGDEPGPVELPTTPHVRDHEFDAEEIYTRDTEYHFTAPSMTSAASTSEPRSSGALEPPTPIDKDDLVSPITPTTGPNEALDGIVSPIDQPSSQQQKFPFKLRNQVFDHRTSMLGSLGADGMPNAHYAFLRDDSPRRAPRSETATPELVIRDENKVPFKLRHAHAGYESDSTAGGSKRSSYLHVPEAEQSASSSSAANRESGALGLQLGDQRIVGDQRDRPPSYEHGPVTNVTMPEPVVARRPVVKDPAPAPAPPPVPTVNGSGEVGEEDDLFDIPPPPPLKDEKYMRPKGKVTGLRKPVQRVDSLESLKMNGVEAVRSAPTTATTISSSLPPAIGELGFERCP